MLWESRLEQRNGRIDRFGQTEQPEIACLMTVPSNPRLQGDLRVLDRLVEKEENAHKNLGDVAWLLNLHDQEKEEERVALGIQEGEAPEEVIPDEGEHTDFMALLLGEDEGEEPSPVKRTPLRLFTDDLSYASEAFKLGLVEDGDLQWHDHLSGFTMLPPEDLLRRFDYLPPELRGAKNELKLSADRTLVMKSLEEARGEEHKWPEWQLFWEQHPVAEWLADRVLGQFDRHEAPVLRVAKGLDPAESVVLFQGMVSNKRSQPTIVEWFGVHFRNGSFSKLSPMDELVATTGLAEGVANPGGGLDDAVLKRLDGLLLPAVHKAREHMKDSRKTRMSTLGSELREGLRRLKVWRDRKHKQLKGKRFEIEAKGRKLSRVQEQRLADQSKEVESRYKERQEWIDLGMRTIDEPYLRVAAVLIPLEGR